jgi:hypothetical protein
LWVVLSHNVLKKRFHFNLFLVVVFCALRATTLGFRVQIASKNFVEESSAEKNHFEGIMTKIFNDYKQDLFIVDLVALLVYQLLFVLNVGVFWSMLRRSRTAGTADTFTMRILVAATIATTALTFALVILVEQNEWSSSSSLLYAYGGVDLVVLLSGSHFIMHVVHLLFLEVAFTLTPFDYLYILVTGKIQSQGKNVAPKLKGRYIFLTRLLFLMLMLQTVHTVRYFISAEEVAHQEIKLDAHSQWSEILLFLFLELPFLFLNHTFLFTSTEEDQTDMTNLNRATKRLEAIKIFKSVAVPAPDAARGKSLSMQSALLHGAESQPEEGPLDELHVGFKELCTFLDQQGAPSVDHHYWKTIVRGCGRETRSDRVMRRLHNPNAAPSLCFEGFFRYLLSHVHNGAFDPAHEVVQEDDMRHPLTDYYINSSHNSYLTNDQLFGKSSVDSYAKMLSAGARCVELDCWDGTDSPIVKHGWTFTSQIFFHDVLVAIKECAFLLSDFPIIVSLEIHNSEEYQLKMAKDLKAVFGGMMVTPTDFPGALELDGSLPSPHDLRRRIIVKADGPLYSTDAKAAAAAAAAVESGASDEELRNILEKQRKEARREAEEEALRLHQEAVEGSAKAATRRLSSAGMRTVKHLDTGGIVPELLALTFLVAGDKSGLKKGKFPGQKVQGKDGRDEGEEQKSWVPAQAISISETETGNMIKDFEVMRMEVLQGTLKDKLAEEQRSAEAVTQRSVADVKDKKNWNILRTVVDTTLFLPNKLKDIMLMSGKVSHLKELSHRQRMSAKVVDHNKKHLVRIYPFGLRFDSSNLDPFAFWATGCQMVCLNYQTAGRGMNLNRGFFAQNGRCGWVLKPPALRAGAEWRYSPAEEVPRALQCSTPEIQVLMIRVLWAHNLESCNSKQNKEHTMAKRLLEGIRSDDDETHIKIETTPGPVHAGYQVDDVDDGERGQLDNTEEKEGKAEEKEREAGSPLSERISEESEHGPLSDEKSGHGPLSDEESGHLDGINIDIDGDTASRPMIAVRMHSMLWKECETSTKPQGMSSPYWNEEFRYIAVVLVLRSSPASYLPPSPRLGFPFSTPSATLHFSS